MNSPPTPAITKRNQESGPTAFAISLNPDNSGMSGNPEENLSGILETRSLVAIFFAL